MHNTILYIITVLIWGSTWLAIEYQLGEVAIEVSLIYRMALACAIIFLFCGFKKLSLHFDKKTHLRIFFLGAFNFSINYIMLYHAQIYLNSAMTSIGFSLMLVINIVNTRLFFGTRIAPKIWFGAAMGIAGICVLFLPELSAFALSDSTFKGVLFVLAGILIASFGNMISAHNSKQEVPIMQANAWGALYGTVICFVYAWFSGSEFKLPNSQTYLLSLGFLSIFGTVVAFFTYFALIKRIGAEKASYAIVLFPVVAIILSTLFEGFEWQEHTISGILLVLAGNLLVVLPQQYVEKLRAIFLYPLRHSKASSKI